MSSDYELGKDGELVVSEDKRKELVNVIMFPLKHDEYYYGQIVNHLENLNVAKSMAVKIADSIFDDLATKDTTVSVKEVGMGIFEYYMALNRACNFYAPRITFTNTNMRFQTLKLQFDDNLFLMVLTTI